jgi:hypothetical protein
MMQLDSASVNSHEDRGQSNSKYYDISNISNISNIFNIH